MSTSSGLKRGPPRVGQGFLRTGIPEQRACHLPNVLRSSGVSNRPHAGNSDATRLRKLYGTPTGLP
jgi:hypothetical protein